MERDYGGVIWTNHALQRMRERNISQGDAWYTWRRSHQSRRGKNGSWVYYRTYGDQRIEVVAKKDERPPARRASGSERKWIILSVWSKKVRTFHEKKRKGLIQKIIDFILNKDQK